MAVKAASKTQSSTQGYELPEVVKNAYSRPEQEVLDALAVDRLKGLDQAEVLKRRELYGLNQLPAPKKKPALLRFLSHFNDVLIYVLLASAGLTAFLGEWIDTFVILGVVVINALVGYIQENKSEKALDGIKNLLSSDATVKREGKWQSIAANELVPGDIVRLQAGDKIPADLRLFLEADAAAEESALTGEAVPAEKDPAPVAEDAGIGDRSSMAFSSTTLTNGSASGVVVATGSHTEIGQINTLMSETTSLKTPLTKQIAQFSLWLSVAVMVAAIALALLNFYYHQAPLSEAVLGAVGFAVAAIPEGLPALITITLALGVQTMARKKAIVRSLPAVQTLGSVSVICSDKTGTLTKNEMTVVEGATSEFRFKVTGSGYDPSGEVENADKELVKTLATTLLLANDTDLSRDENGHYTIVGEPTEGAVVTFAHKALGDQVRAVQNLERDLTLPFSSSHKFMAVKVADEVLLKGAPDVLLARSVNQLEYENESPVTKALELTYWRDLITELSDQGLRVLAAAKLSGCEDVNDLSLDALKDLTFIGLVGIVDPPREEATLAIETAQQAGIDVKMITGDHAGTANAIARQMGINTKQDPVTGAELEAVNDDELIEIAAANHVFARTSPEHKLRLVKALQKQGEVVAMTGDGVNDSPALRRADVGVAMGIKGTEVTKESAEIVLADDNFATIEAAVEEGRRILDNLRKALVFLLVTNGAQSLVMLVAILAGWLLPLSPLHILWVNMVTAITLAFAYSFEPAEEGIMQRPPAKANESIVHTRHLIQIAIASIVITAATMGIFYWRVDAGQSVEHARTLATLVLVMGQVFYLFNVKALESSSFKREVFTNNKVAWYVVALLLLLQAGFTYLPFMHNLFGTESLGFISVAVAVGAGAVVFVIIEILKAVLYRSHNRP